jgi:hypothetical protein
MLTDKLRVVNSKYFCSKCDYYTNKTSSYAKHLTTHKHNEATNENVATYTFECNLCNKAYKSRVGLWKHKKTCKEPIDTPYIPKNMSCITENPSLVIELLKQNQEFKELILEERREFQKIITDQNTNMMKMAENMGSNHHNTSNTNTTNNKFNLNVFLNEQCKDAMSLKDFVKNLEISMEDFINTGELGFIDGLSKVMIAKINTMDIHDRPIHCTDLKRETVYIKDADKWEKDANKEQLRNAVKGVAYKNERMRPIWYEETPEVDILGSTNCEKFFKYSTAALGGYGKEETKTFEDKIMKNIMKEVTIDKQTLLE